MSIDKPLLVIITLFLTISIAFSQSEITWQLHHGQGEGIFVPGPNDPPIEEILNKLTGAQPIHGDSGGFDYANIPSADDVDWEVAPIDEDGDLCWRLDRSRVNGGFAALDFTYFQAIVNILRTNEPFLIRYTQVDDGVRAYVFNAAHPNGTFIKGGDARLYATPAEVDLSSLFVVGINRIVLVQFDDSQTENYLKASVIRNEDTNECGNDTEAPKMFGILADGSEVLLSELIQERYDCGEQPFVEVKAVDNCDPNPAFNQRIDSSLNVDGTSTVTLQFGVRDASGNENREIYSYIDGGEDVEAPQIFGILADGTEAPLSELIQERFDCKQQPFEDIRIIDNCDPDPTLESVTTFSPNPDGSQNIRVEYIITDASGNTIQEVYNYIDGGEDTDPPSISSIIIRPDFIQDTLLITEDLATDTFPCNTTMVFPPYDSLIAEDNCDPNPIIELMIDSTFAEDGSFISTLTITATDINGNSNQKSYTYVRLPDTEGPELNCSIESLSFRLDNIGVFVPTKDNLNLFAFDECNNDISYQFEPSEVTNIGNTLINVIATDGVGNTNECSVEVFIEGTPCDISITNIGGVAANCVGEATGALIILGSSSSANRLEYSIDGTNFQSGNIFENLLPNIYTITVREVERPDCLASESFILISEADNEAPELNCPLEAISFPLDDTGSFVPTKDNLNLSAFDECSDDISYEFVPSEVTEIGSTIIKIIVTDEVGNTSECSVEIILEITSCDVVITSIGGRPANCLGEATGSLIILASGSDNELEYSIDDINFQSGNIFEDLLPKAYTITIREVSNLNCTVSDSFTIISEADNNAPQIFAIRADSVEEGDSTVIVRDTILFSAVFIGTSITYTCGTSPLDPYDKIIVIDDCDPSPSFQRIARISSSFDENGNIIFTTIIKYEVSDASGNTAVDSIHFFSQQDMKAPEFTDCPIAPITISLDETGVLVPSEDNIPAIAFDSCDGQALTYIYEPAEITEVGLVEIVITATDSKGNTSEACTVLINVSPNINDSPNDEIQNIAQEEELRVSIHPNPFHHQTNVQVNLSQANDIEIVVRDLNGKMMKIINYERVVAGQSSFPLDFGQLNLGIYAISVRTATAQQTVRVVVTQ